MAEYSLNLEILEACTTVTAETFSMKLRLPQLTTQVLLQRNRL